MLLNCGVGEDSWESLGLQEIQPVHPKGNQSWIFIGRTDIEAGARILWPPDVKNWLTGKTLMPGKLKAGGEGDNKGWDDWMASLTQWTWVWARSGIWWWTGKYGMLQSMRSKRVGHNWVTELNWIAVNVEHLLLAYWSTVFLLWSIFSCLLPLLWQCYFFVCLTWVVWAVHIFWKWTLVSCVICKDFLPVGGLSFHFVMVSFPVQKLLGLNMSCFFILFLFIFPWRLNLRKDC